MTITAGAVVGHAFAAYEALARIDGSLAWTGHAGSAGLRNGGAIPACFRDISASEAHVFTDHNSWADAAAAILNGRRSPWQ
jgi:hypothetical protein